MSTRMEQYLRDYDYHLTRPTRRVAVSPRAPKEARRPWWVVTMVRKIRRKR